MKNEHRTSNIERPTSNKKQTPNTEYSIAISALTHLTVSVYRVLQMRGVRVADVLHVLQVPDNKADAVPCERLPKFYVPQHVNALS